MLDREIRRLTRLSVHGQATDADRQRLQHLQAVKRQVMTPTFRRLATALQIGSWTGHYSLSEVAHYTQEMDRKSAVMGTERDQNDANKENPSAKRLK